MKKLFKLIYSNKFFAFIMLIAQIVMLVAAYIWLEDYNTYIISASTILKIVLIIYEINRDDEPSFKIAWIVLMAVFPVFGALFYLFIRVGFISRDIHSVYETVLKKTRPYLVQDDSVIDEIKAVSESAASLARYFNDYGGSPAYKNTAVKYYPLGDNMFEDMKKELLKATDFIFLEFFIININGRMWPEILEILKKKVREGVEVRVLYDGMGCMNTLPRNYPEQLKKAGIECAIFSPIQPLLSTHQNNRDHRKLMIIDGRTVFVGGINLADEYINEIERFGHWKDTGVMLTGEAVAGFTGMFLGMWDVSTGVESDNYKEYITVSSNHSAKADGFIVPFADSPLDSVFVGKRAYIDNMNNAKKYVHIMTPYLVLDNGMFEAINYASQRGVDVKIILPHIPDKSYAFWLARSYYPELISAGVKIYEYAPGFVHAKMSVADGNRAIVGTINHDYRSLYLHYECAAYMFDVPAIMDIENDFKETLEKCIPITMEEYKKFNIFSRLAGKVIRVFAPLL